MRLIQLGIIATPHQQLPYDPKDRYTGIRKIISHVWGKKQGGVRDAAPPAAGHPPGVKFHPASEQGRPLSAGSAGKGVRTDRVFV